MKKKIMIVAPARSGKDAVGDLLKEFSGYSFVSSSEFACEKVVFPILKHVFDYKTPKECFEDRHRSDGMRATWFQLIQNYSSEDRTRLSKEIFAENDLYIGCRNQLEFIPTMEKGVADLAIWVDRSLVVDPEPETSMTITRDIVERYPHYILDNNGDIEQLKKNVHTMIKELKL